MGSGSARSLRYVEEVVFGETPASPDMLPIRNTGGEGIQLNRSTLESAEYRSDRAIPGLRLGNVQVGLNVPFEFSFQSFDDLLKAALGGNWAAAYSLTGLTVDVDAVAKAFTRSAGSWITDGVKVGDRVTFSGFLDPENNDTFLVSAVAELVLTCETATGLVNVTADGPIAVSTNREILLCGVGLPSFTIEEAFTDIGVYQAARGMMVNSMSLTIQPDSIITGSFALIGKAADAPAAATIANTVAAANTNDVFAAHQGSIKEDGADIAIATAISLSLENGLEAKFPVFTNEARRIGEGRTRVTGEVSVFFEDKTLLEKYVNETESSLEFQVIDPVGNDYLFVFPRVKFSSEGKTMSENDVTQRLGYQALHDETAGTTMQIERRSVA